MSKEDTSSTTKDWILFVISTIIMIAMLIWVNEWFWLALPFSLTYLVKALRMM
ncbi:MAG: hypothetical protein AAF573_08485 [Bacteroidota bacterium]